MDSDYFLQLFSSVEVVPPSLGAVVAFIVALFLLIASGFISASEIAFFSLSPNDKQQLSGEEDSKSKQILQLLDRSEHLLATILIGNNLVNVGLVILFSYFMESVLILSPLLSFVAQSIVLTFLLLLFGEIMPKIYASNHGVKMARRAASTLAILQNCFMPLANLLVSSTRFVNHYVTPRNSISIDEISQALEMTDVQEHEEKELLEGIVKFGDKCVDEIMTPRVDMVGIDITTDFASLVQCVVETGYSRIPVFEGTEDSIKGIIYIKDLLPYLNEGADFAWQKLVRQAHFIPENKRVESLLDEFQEQKRHMSIVVDEYGGTCGIVTMEDILEEIVGEISDEYDDEEVRLYRKVDDNTYIFDGKILLNDLTRVTGIDEEYFDKAMGESDTLAGLILEIKGDFPNPKEHIDYGFCHFVVLEVNKRRVVKVKLCIEKGEK